METFGSKSQEFFDEKIETLFVSKEEFLEMMKLKNPDMSDEDILQIKGINFDLDGKVVILIRNDVYPEEFLPYLETHEKWEAYVARKDGYNLFNKSVRKYRKDRKIDEFDQESKKEFYDNLAVYNYDFRHEYAVYKEYEQALNEGKLDEYHEWFMKTREKEKQSATEEIMKLIENDSKIRESIYSKLKNGTRHKFLKQ